MNIVDYVTEGLSLLRERYKSADTLKAILTAGANRLQSFEAALFEVLNGVTDLQTAVGVQLDMIGAIVGQERFGSDDDGYRGLIALKIAENNSEGTPEDLISLARGILNPERVEYLEIYPAEFSMVIVNPDTTFSDTQVAQSFQRAKPAGVGSGYIERVTTPTFAFAPTVEPDRGGFGDANDPDVGGKFGAVYV